MATFLTARQLADRTAAAVAAAVAAGRGLGLTVAEPTVLHDVFSVVVHLAPAPVVARVPTVLPHTETLATLARRQRDELAVTRWLADRGVPVIPPSPLVPAEPVRRDGHSMTFWAYVPEDRDREPDHVATLSAADPGSIDASLAELDRHPTLIDAADLDRARREWRALAPLARSRTAFEARFPGVELQPLHGDSPPANIFHGVDGDRYADFELVTLGPVEWDLAGLGPEHAAAYDRGARRVGGRPLDPGVLDFVNALGMLRVVATLTLAPRLPQLLDYLGPALDQWRATPFAGGVTD